MYRQGGTTSQWGKEGLCSILLDEQAHYTEQNKIDLVTTRYTKADSRRMKDLNVKVQTIQLLEENVQFLCDLKVGKDLLTKSSNVKSLKKKIDFDYTWAMLLLIQRLEC